MKGARISPTVDAGPEVGEDIDQTAEVGYADICLID
jgi:hypothetical protein